MPGGGAGSGVFSVVWGVWASVFGWIIATDFRGAAHRFHQLSRRPVSFGVKSAPRVGVTFVRVLAAVFALLGPVVLVAGVVDLLRGGQESGDPHRQPAPFAVALGLVAALSLWGLWRRNGPLRREWTDGAGFRRVAVVVMTAACLGFVITLVLGHRNAMLATWLLAGLASLPLLLNGDRGSDDDSADV